MPPLFVVHGSDLVPIGGWGEKLCSPKVSGVQTGIISKLYLGSPGTKSHSDAGAVPQIRAVMSKVSPRLRVACPNTKGCRMSSNHFVVDVGCRTQ